MGGCRCTYKNCTVRTDGKTHMFHYPVMDKMRCHQWLTNARRLDFLNLTVSQLKNRVVCQHHFKDNNFMNYMKDKLRFDAVPTEDGPFCDTAIKNENLDLNYNKTPSITIDDIENDVIMSRDLVNLTMKYGDFLTNSDLMETFVINENNKISTVNEYDTKYTNNDVKTYTPRVADTKILLSAYPPMKINKHQEKVKPVQLIKRENSNLINTPTVIDNQEMITLYQINETNPSLVNKPVMKHREETEIFQPLHTNNKKKTGVINPNVYNNRAKNYLQNESKVNHNKVKILSEKTISQPLFVKGKLEPVPPSLDLSEVSRKREIKTENTSDANNHIVQCYNNKEKTNTNLENIIEAGQTNCSSPIAEQCKKPSKLEQKKNIDDDTIKVDKEEPKSIQAFKTKMSAEKLAAIQEKRKFNMKLKDIIEAGIIKLDEQERNNNNTVVSISSSKQKHASENVGSFLSKESELPNISNYTIACLEARMKRMENILCNKIDQNSQRIVDLKNSLLVDNKKTKSIATQTPVNEEAHKKYLYQEISKHLSPEANSLIYEELFINKYTNSLTRCSSDSKRRKFR